MIGGTAVEKRTGHLGCLCSLLLCGAEDVLVYITACVMLKLLEEIAACVVSVSHMTGYSLSKHVVSHFSESHF